MSRRALLAAALLGSSAVAACGPEASDGSPLALTLLSSAVAPAERYDVRVLGDVARCEAVLAEPSAWLTTRGCEPAEADPAARCHLAHVIVQPGATSRIESVPAGARTVFVVGRDAEGSALSKGCAEVVVTAGEATAVTITLVDAP